MVCLLCSTLCIVQYVDQGTWWYEDGWFAACSKTPVRPSVRLPRQRFGNACWASLDPLLGSSGARSDRPLEKLDQWIMHHALSCIEKKLNLTFMTKYFDFKLVCKFWARLWKLFWRNKQNTKDHYIIYIYILFVAISFQTDRLRNKVSNIRVHVVCSSLQLIIYILWINSFSLDFYIILHPSYLLSPTNRFPRPTEASLHRLQVLGGFITHEENAREGPTAQIGVHKGEAYEKGRKSSLKMIQKLHLLGKEKMCLSITSLMFWEITSPCSTFPAKANISSHQNSWSLELPAELTRPHLQGKARNASSPLDPCAGNWGPRSFASRKAQSPVAWRWWGCWYQPWKVGPGDSNDSLHESNDVTNMLICFYITLSRCISTIRATNDPVTLYEFNWPGWWIIDCFDSASLQHIVRSPLVWREHVQCPQCEAPSLSSPQKWSAWVVQVRDHWE